MRSFLPNPASRPNCAGVLAWEINPGVLRYCRILRRCRCPLDSGCWCQRKRRKKTALQGSIADQIEGIGHVSNQSDSRVCFRLSGPGARAVMAKGCRLDLHPKVVQAGFCAQTVVAQIGVILHQVDDTPTYHMLVYSGFALDFRDWIEAAASEFVNSQ